MIRRASLAIAVMACLALPAARAEVKLHHLFTDGMVLQQGMKIPIWGTAEPNETISVSLAKEGPASETRVTQADKDGNWRVHLAPEKAGGPYSLTVNKTTLKDVYIGEVWIASGQSNMECSV